MKTDLELQKNKFNQKQFTRINGVFTTDASYKIITGINRRVYLPESCNRAVPYSIYRTEKK